MLDLGTLQAHIKLDGVDKFQQDLDSSASKSDSLAAKLKSGLSGVGKFLGKTFIAMGAAAAAGFAAITKGSVKAYADTEQLRGGVEKLFGHETAKTIEQNAQAAFATAGISANQYMESVTSFSAALLQSVGNDTDKAAQVADMAMRDMSDNANVFGSDMASIQNAYQGFAKQNYTMLDNLKLGYGGTKTEMERLLADAGKLTGQKYDISNLNDVYEAIHAIQVEQNITGTTAKEAEKTISGSIASTKAAYENFLAGLADPTADIGALTDTLVNSAMNVVGNIIPVVENIISSIGDVFPQIVEKINQLLPQLLTTLIGLLQNAFAVVPDLLGGLLDGIVQALPQLLDALLELFNGLVADLPALIDKIVAALPQVINAVVAFIPQLMPALAQAGVTLFSAIIQNLPEIVSALVTGAVQLVDAFIQGWFSQAGVVASAGAKVIGKLIDGISKGISKLTAPLAKLKSGVQKAVNAVKRAFTNMRNSVKNAVNNIKATISNMVNSISNAFSRIPALINRVVGWFKGLGGRIKGAVGSLGSLLSGAGKALMSGLLSGITAGWEAIKSKVSGMGSWIKEHKGPKEYDLKLLVDNGQWIMTGLLNGIESSMPALQSKLNGVAATIQGTNFNASAALGFATGGAAAGYNSNDTTYNVYIDGTRINDDAQIEGKFRDLLTSMARKGMM